MIKMHKLWPADHGFTEIIRIEKLQALKNLRDLQLGNNRISSIGESLNESINLEV
jgi:Leucine-rich repeat (LRR) protein